MILPGGKLRAGEDGALLFWCPGCDGAHRIMVGQGAGPRWGYNGNSRRPTFTPSIHVQGHQLVIENGKWTGEWMRNANGDLVPSVCHSFVTDGRIQFLCDCTHDLVGQTVDLPDWEDG